ncbi:PLP-dependent aminotransferase family protein [Labrys okinawensis]|uniref:MocR-like pyridoxine biosynthesis transcription factor PdxR n=1 Tax=Labrys okinawensis TaxID=346911 RepID=UPI0039BD70A8
MPVLPGSGPRSRELYVAIRKLIETGQASPGTKLPTTRDLAQRLGLSRAAAVAAFEMLVADGFTEARVGSGTFVSTVVPTIATAPPVSVLPRSQRALPCELGVATIDQKTMAIFRRLLSRSLLRPGPEHFHYGDSRGGPAVREAIAAYLRTARGVRCDAEQIIVTTGTMHGMNLVVRAMLVPGDEAWIEDPCYMTARAVLESIGARVIGIPVDREGLDAERGEELAPRARLAYVTPSHQFPLGVPMTMRRRLALLDWAKRRNAWIIEDDYDSEYRFAGAPLTALQGMDGAERVVYLGTFSKVLFPGIRIGYAVVPKALLPRIVALRGFFDRQPPTLAEAAVAEFLDGGHFAAHLRRTRRRVEAGRDALLEALACHAAGALSVMAPDQGLHLVAGLGDNRDDSAVASRLVAAGVGAKALSPMYLDLPPRQGLVLGFSGFDGATLAAAAATIGGVLSKS